MDKTKETGTDKLLSRQFIHSLSRSVPNEQTQGIYFLLDGKRVVYVGQSKSVRARIGNHLSSTSKTFDSYWMIEIKSAEDLNLTEARYIDALQPKYNKAMPNVGVVSEFLINSQCDYSPTEIRNTIETSGIYPSYRLHGVNYYDKSCLDLFPTLRPWRIRQLQRSKEMEAS